MTLAGTRPPLISETNLYELHHRARLAIKPGITGMWQVSGRSDITDFEEVVRLDKEYITNWNIGLDIKILFKTVLVVFKLFQNICRRKGFLWKDLCRNWSRINWHIRLTINILQSREQRKAMIIPFMLWITMRSMAVLMTTEGSGRRDGTKEEVIFNGSGLAAYVAGPFLLKISLKNKIMLTNRYKIIVIFI